MFLQETCLQENVRFICLCEIGFPWHCKVIVCSAWS